MFDIGADEMLFTAVVAVIAIGPKELPRALHLAGRWIGKFRRMSGAFRSGVEAMIREAEITEMEQNWAAGRDSVLEQYAEHERQRNRPEAAEESVVNGLPDPDMPAPDAVVERASI